MKISVAFNSEILNQAHDFSLIS